MTLEDQQTIDECISDGTNTAPHLVSGSLTPYGEAQSESTKDVFRSCIDTDNLDIQWTRAYREPIKIGEFIREKLFQLLSVKDYQYDEIYKEMVTAINRYLDRSPCRLETKQLSKDTSPLYNIHQTQFTLSNATQVQLVFTNISTNA